MLGFDLTPEQEQEIERQRIRSELRFGRITRLIAEMPIDDATALRAAFTAIAASSNPAGLAHWWDGILFGSIMAREIRLGERGDEEEELDPDAHHPVSS